MPITQQTVKIRSVGLEIHVRKLCECIKICYAAYTPAWLYPPPPSNKFFVAGKDRRILRSWADPSKDTPSPLQSQSSPEAPFTPESQPAASATAPEPSTSGGETFFGEASAVATKPPALETHEESIPAGPGAGDPDLSGILLVGQLENGRQICKFYSFDVARSTASLPECALLVNVLC